MSQKRGRATILVVKGDKEVLKQLQLVLTAELTAINQYFLHYGMMENWGYHRLAKIMRRASIFEMKAAEEVLERMLYLEGPPDMTGLNRMRIGKNVQQQLESDLVMAKDASKDLNHAIGVAMKAGDNTTRELLEGILLKEEDHIDFLEAQVHQIGEMGYERYLAEQMGDED